VWVDKLDKLEVDRIGVDRMGVSSLVVNRLEKVVEALVGLAMSKLVGVVEQSLFCAIWPLPLSLSWVISRTPGISSSRISIR
jgi:hypothetical protein